MASTPLLMTLVRRFNREDAPITAALDGPEIAGAARAIVIGYGRVGQTVAQMIMAQGASVTVIDSNPERSEEHTSELQSLMRNSYAVFCLKKKKDRLYSI